jgi:hypothetical protein
MNSPSHIQTVLSRLQLARSVPVQEYATLLHSVSCPSSVLINSHSPSCDAKPSSSSDSCSQIPIFESNDAVASVFPDGAQARARTVFLCPVGIDECTENWIPWLSLEALYVYSLTDLSAEHEANNGLVGFQATCQALSSCAIEVNLTLNKHYEYKNSDTW